VEVKSRQVGDKLTLEEANLLRTCRKLFEGQICIPSRVWDGTGKAHDAMRLTIAA
jgi:2-methylaconitate cis-trans-isomerase PrpF